MPLGKRLLPLFRMAAAAPSSMLITPLGFKVNAIQHFRLFSFFFFGTKNVPISLPEKSFIQDIRLAAVCDYHGNSRSGNLSCSVYLAEHSAGAEGTGDVSGKFYDVLSRMVETNGISSASGYCAGIFCIKAVDIRQVDQNIRIHQECNHGRKVVIVSKLNFFDHHRVVFIDDRNNLP